ncbi:MAG: hypothetical protein SFU53_01555 [Terrimicrobiaceae bacterium]|nr:hypothetical protein [Terrimicrobiaceae bacterium]
MDEVNQQTGNKLQKPLLIAAFTILLSTAWIINPFGAQGFPDTRFTRPTPEPGSFSEVSNRIVAVTTERRMDGTTPSAFMLLTEDNRLLEVRNFFGEDFPNMTNDAAPYYSQFGIQADLALALSRGFGSAAEGLLAFRFVITVAAAAAFSIFLLWVVECLSWKTALLVTAVMAFADWMIIFSQSIFFMAFLNVLAFSLPWILLAKGGSIPKKAFGTAVSFHLVITFARCLAGYEYLTCLILAPVPALTYASWMEGFSIFRWIRRCMIFVAAGTLAFLVAVGCQFVKAVSVEGLPPNQALAFLVYRSSDNTQVGLGPLDFNRADAALKASSRVYRALNKLGIEGPSAAKAFLTAYRSCAYLAGNLLTLPRGIGVPFVVFLAGYAAAIWLYRKRRKRFIEPRKADALFVASAAAFLASASWLALAFNHSMIHTYYNLICFYFAFVPTALSFVGYLLFGNVVAESRSQK